MYGGHNRRLKPADQLVDKTQMKTTRANLRIPDRSRAHANIHSALCSLSVCVLLALTLVGLPLSGCAEDTEAPKTKSAADAPTPPIEIVKSPAPSGTAHEAPGPIQDNSFLVEEAYNQEYGVVQHINSFTRYSQSKDWVYSFTQEWPGLSNARHQFSYTLIGMSAGAYPGSGTGVGDAMLNYRYQLVGSGETRLAFAPRFSLLIPSGNSQVGRGFGGWGMQVNLPASLVLNRYFVTHWNVGSTIVPRAQDVNHNRALSTGYNLGQSVVWLARTRFNVLLETVWAGSEAVIGAGQTQRAHSLYLSPGVRWAHNLSHHLQIVPGVAVPLGVGPSRGEKGLLLYLSFEHPFKAPLDAHADEQR